MRPTILHTPLLVSLAWLVACSGDEKDTGATDTGTATDTATASDTGTGSDTDTGSGTDTATNTATATATDTGVEPENQAPAFNAVADVTTYATSAVSVQVRDGDTSAGVATSTDVATMLVSLAEGEAASVRVDVADPEGGTIELQLGGSCDSCGVESWVRLVEGTLWLTPLHRDAGEYVVYVTARDPEGATTTLEFPVHVDNVVRVRRVYDNYPLGGGTAVDEVHPTWSPDSTQVAFSGNPGQNADIFVMSALAGEPFTDTNQDGIRGPGEPFADLDMSLGYDGPGVPQRLTNFDGSVGTHEDIDGGAADVEPAWSPDGSTIAFASNRGDGRYRIFRMADDGSGQTALFDGSFGRAPAWAPTGASTSRQLAYARSVSDGADLVVTDLEPAVGPGGNPELRASTPEVIVAIPDVGEFEGVWTPEGIEPARVAFVSDRAGPRALWVYTPSTGDLRALTPAGGEDARPCWSPDGTWLAFERDEGGARDVWAVDAAGDGLVNLTGDLDGEQREPAWSPDGAWIAFADDSGASWDLWKMSVDTSAALVAGDAVQLTRDEMGPAGPILRDDRAPSWAPDGSFLVFSGALDGGAADLYEAWTDGVDDIDLPVVEAVTEAVWSPDHTRLAFVRTCPADAVTCTPGASAVWVYDAWAATPQDALQPASPRTRFAGSPPVAQAVLAEVGGPAWSPDGRFLMYHTDQDEGEADGRGVMHLRVYDVDTRVDADVVDPEDVDGDGRLDVDEDVDGDGRRDAAEDQDDDDHLDVDEDVDNDGRRDAAEDLDGDGRRDVAEDVDGDGRRDVDEDVDGDGRRDVDEDADRDQELDDGEDVDGDGRLDAAEPDLDGDGRLDDGEDLDGDGRLDAAELDLDGDGRLDVAEPDADADGRLDGAAEDLDGDGRLDVDEDLDGDGRLDIDEDVNGDGRLGLLGGRDAAWLPEGAAWTAASGGTLAFVSERAGDGAQVFVAPVQYDSVAAVWTLGATSQRTTTPDAAMRRPTWSRDGAWLAFEDATAALSVIRVQGVSWSGGAVLDTVHPTYLLVDGAAPAFSPDDDTLAYVDDGGVFTVPVTAGANPDVAPSVGLSEPLDWTPPGDGEIRTVTWGEGGHTLVLSVSSSTGDAAYEARVDGTALVMADALTVTEADERDPAVAPEGDAVAYVSDADAGSEDIWLLPLGLGEARQVTGELGDDGVDGRPTWVDAETVAYQSDVDGGYDIHTIGVRGASASVLVPHHVGAAAWSADGSGVAYVTDADGELALCHHDLLLGESTCYANETPELEGAADPFFAPDGKLYFASALDGDSDIYVATWDGAEWTVENLTADSAADETQPALSPDGSMLAFVSDRGLYGTRGLYVVDY